VDLNKVQETLFMASRNIREGGQEVEPVVFFYLLGQIIASPLVGDTSKWREMIQNTLKEARSVEAVFVISEGWTVPQSDVPMAMASRLAGLESIRDYPTSFEIVQCMMEKADGTSRIIYSAIHTDGSLGPVETLDLSKANQSFRGRLTNLFDLSS
jgi:hypothetical protein